jgi:hypothetical protein
MPLTPLTDGYDHLSEVDGTNDAKFKFLPQQRQHLEAAGELIHFDGRALPVGFSGEPTDDAWTVSFMVNKDKDGTEQWEACRKLVDDRRGRVLLWRDQIGTSIYVWLLAADRELIPHPSSTANLARVSFVVTRVDYP